MASKEFSQTQYLDDQAMVVSLLHDINQVISNLLKLTSSWGDQDYDAALGEIHLAMNRLEEARSQIKQLSNPESQHNYLEQVEDVQQILHTLESLLVNKLGYQPAIESSP